MEKYFYNELNIKEKMKLLVAQMFANSVVVEPIKKEENGTINQT